VHYLKGMARLADRTKANASGDLFVDSSCIGCDTCRRLAPATYGGGEGDTSYVARQPATDDERRRALMALVSCPTSSIGSISKTGLAEAVAALPDEVAPGVFDCGFAAESSFGAASWFVRRPGGNVLVDSPRASRPLVARLKALGGVRFLFLTHRDDVADHARLARALGCDRVIHVRDETPGTAGVEQKIVGDEPVELGEGLLVIPVPGHTAGSAALLWNDTYLFTGDHLWGDAGGRLGVSRSVCWWDWESQLRSLDRLLEFRFRWVLPGHGRPARRDSPEEMWEALEALIAEARGRA